MIQAPDYQSIPQTPGIYIFYDDRERPVYVGKAKVLRNRVSSYFRKEEDLPSKTRVMLRQAVALRFISTTNEKEALLLEASLIKKHRPRYNILLRDDKDHTLFRFSLIHNFPRLEILRRPKVRDKQKALLFGPFSNTGAARETWRSIHRAYPLRRCTDRAMTNRVRPCLYHYLGQCLAPCVLEVNPAEYAKLVKEVSLLLSGRSGELLQTLNKAMLEASEALDFEQAAILRDRIEALEETVEKQAVVLPGGGDLDVAGLAENSYGLGLCIIFVREGTLIDSRSFHWPGLSLDEAPELLASFLTQFYQNAAVIPPRLILPWPLPTEEASEAEARFISDVPCPFGIPGTSGAPDVSTTLQAALKRESSGGIPDEPGNGLTGEWPVHLTDDSTSGPAGNRSGDLAGRPANADPSRETEQSGEEVLAAVLSSLRGGAVRVGQPRDNGENRLVELAVTNARQTLISAEKNPETLPMHKLLADKLHLSRPVYRIEAVDISHTGGSAARAGMVVFEDGKPLKSAYRAYKLEIGGQGDSINDDYANLAAWAKRRAESGPPWADLVLIDGGKGQLAAVLRAFEDAGLKPGPGLEHDFPVAAIAKARDDEGRPDRRAGNIRDRIFLPLRSNPLPLRDGSPELLFLQHVRDTVHNFVIGRHRRARSSAALQAELLRLPGVGPRTARLLMEQFGSLKELYAAGQDALNAVPGLGKARAESIWAAMRKIM